MIAPDTKDWTWVLARACPECGFDAATCRADEVAGLVRENSQAWHRLLAAGAIRPGRPNGSTWSTLEYACHVRDVYRRFLSRIDLMLSEDDPLFENWDQDASAVADAYERQAAATVVDELNGAAQAVASQLDGVAGPAWQRPGRRSDGASFEVQTIARYMLHDTVHHLWDVGQQDR
jgi:hypothetical protein